MYAAHPRPGIAASLYIHIPFCAGKCDYCDFVSRSVESSSPLIDEYLAHLYDDIQTQLVFYNVIDVPTVYIGGGTPSLIGAARLRALCAFLRGVLPERPHEWTLEVNPESLNEEIIAVCKEAGVTRVSVGIQTLNEASRSAIGRAGSAKTVLHQIELLRGAPFDVSFDILAGIPYQTTKILCYDIETLLAYNPAHISLYDLTLEEKTPLAKKIRAGLAPLPAPEEAEEISLYGTELLRRGGFEHYEVSNYARCGARSIHNMRYWQMKNWLGAGLSASGTIIDDEHAAAQRRVDGVVESLDTKTLLKETLMMGLRCVDGVDEALFLRRFKNPPEYFIPQTLKKYRARRFIQREKTAPTEEGLRFAGAIARDAFAEIDT